MKKLFQKFKRHQFMFEELVKRDFKQKYKHTVLGMGWSLLSPLFTLLIMRIVFTQFFGRSVEHYTTYLFAGNLIFSFFKESTKGGMVSLLENSPIFTKINVPKYIFLLTKNVSSIINFALTLVVFFLFAAIDGIHFSWRFFALIYPFACLILFNIGIGLILSALFVFFRDITYLYDLFTMLLMYTSAIFYTVDGYPMWMQNIFLCNPVYCVIKYVRLVVIDGSVPSLAFHGLLLFYALLSLFVGGLIYKKKNHEFLYYV